MSSSAAFELSRLRSIGWGLWDAVGLRSAAELHGGGAPADEYDEYLLQAAHRLRRGAAASDVARYLAEIERTEMSLGSNDSSFSRAAAAVDAIKAYLETLADRRA